MWHSIFKFSGTFVLFSMVTVSIHIRCQRVKVVLFSPHENQYITFLYLKWSFYKKSILSCVRYYFIIIYICIPKIINKVEYLSMYLLIICVSVGKKNTVSLLLIFSLLCHRISDMLCLLVHHGAYQLQISSPTPWIKFFTSILLIWLTGLSIQTELCASFCPGEWVWCTPKQRELFVTTESQIFHQRFGSEACVCSA